MSEDYANEPTAAVLRQRALGYAVTVSLFLFLMHYQHVFRTFRG